MGIEQIEKVYNTKIRSYLEVVFSDCPDKFAVFRSDPFARDLRAKDTPPWMWSHRNNGLPQDSHPVQIDIFSNPDMDINLEVCRVYSQDGDSRFPHKNEGHLLSMSLTITIGQETRYFKFSRPVEAK